MLYFAEKVKTFHFGQNVVKIEARIISLMNDVFEIAEEIFH